MAQKKVSNPKPETLRKKRRDWCLPHRKKGEKKISQLLGGREKENLVTTHKYPGNWECPDESRVFQRKGPK